MRAALRTLLEGVIDYAGLFPPAKLTMEDAVAGYVAYRGGPEQWILSRFVCPAARLNDFQVQLERLPNAPSVPMSVLGTSGPDIDTFESALEADAKAMTAFENAMGDRAPILGFEVKLPRPQDADKVIRDLKSFDHVDVFLEVGLGEGMEESLAAIAETEWMAAKGRSGGVEPSQIPSSLALGAFLKQAIDLDLEFKLTAGLHDPIRHFDERVGAELHGYLNCLMACAIHLDHDLSVDEIATILDAKDEAVMRAEDSALYWGNVRVELDAVDDLRTRFLGFGSCSVLEPLEGLEKMGLMGGRI